MATALLLHLFCNHNWIHTHISLSAICVFNEQSLFYGTDLNRPEQNGTVPSHYFTERNRFECVLLHTQLPNVSLNGQTLTRGGESLVKFLSSSSPKHPQEFIGVLIGLVTNGSMRFPFLAVSVFGRLESGSSAFSEHIPIMFTSTSLGTCC